MWHRWGYSTSWRRGSKGWRNQVYQDSFRQETAQACHQSLFRRGPITWCIVCHCWTWLAEWECKEAQGQGSTLEFRWTWWITWHFEKSLAMTQRKSCTTVKWSSQVMEEAFQESRKIPYWLFSAQWSRWPTCRILRIRLWQQFVLTKIHPCDENQ